MIDLTSAGDRSLEALDSLADFQFALRAAPVKADLFACLKNLKLSEKSLQVVDQYMRSPDHIKTLPINIWEPVKNNQSLQINLPPNMHSRSEQSLSNPVIKSTDSRIFQMSMPSIILVVPRIKTKASGNNFIY